MAIPGLLPKSIRNLKGDNQQIAGRAALLRGCGRTKIENVWKGISGGT